MTLYGAYETIESRPALRFERRLAHPVEVVWRAITESDQLMEWIPSRVEVQELRAGAEIKFRFENMPLDAPSTMTGRVTASIPRGCSSSTGARIAFASSSSPCRTPRTRACSG